MAIIETKKVKRCFQVGGEKIYALKDISLAIEPRTLTILKGRSGSGKTTLINLLGTLDRPTEGEIFFGGKEIAHIAEIKRDELRKKKMGFVFQSVALISMMTAYENVEFGLRVSEYKASERRKRAEECLSIVGLQKRMNHRVQELSGGEQQRVAIARAIAHNPTVLFADEPTAELDTHTGLQVMKVFRTLIEKEGVTVIMTTHDPNMMELADRVFELQDGEIVDVVDNNMKREADLHD